jgi:hypothetical protein
MTASLLATSGKYGASRPASGKSTADVAQGDPVRVFPREPCRDAASIYHFWPAHLLARCEGFCMRTTRIAKVMALLNTALVAAAVYYVTRVANYTPLSELPNTDMFAFSAPAIPPLLAAWAGAWVAGDGASGRILAIGLTLAVAAYAGAFALVLTSDEPLAPLLLILTSLWVAIGLVVMLIVVWLVGRSEAKSRLTVK